MAVERPAGPAVAARDSAPADRFRNLADFPEVSQQSFLAARRGMEWLFRMNQPNGRFVPGFVPALNVALEGDHFLRQATAAFALARAARFTGEEKYAVRAAHSALALLAETTNEADGRTTPEPSVVCNKVAASALLTLAVCELPDVDADLLARGEELCKFLKSRLRDDGSVRSADGIDAEPAVDAEYGGLAAYALIASNRVKPAAWKAEAVAKALFAVPQADSARSRTRPWPGGWRRPARRSPRRSRRRMPSAALEFAEWLATKQFDPADPKRAGWRGGYADPAGKPGDGPSAGADGPRRPGHVRRLPGAEERGQAGRGPV